MATGPAIEAPAQVAVFAKAPVPGLAKTRLIPALGPAGAARLHRRLTLRALAAARAAGTGPVTLWCAPDARHRFFRALRRAGGVACEEQRGPGLGERMGDCFERLLPRGRVLLMGTDCPALAAERLRAAARTLRHVDAFLQPASDGGYVLIGLRRLDPALFQDVPWGSATVMSETRRRLAALGWSWCEGETLHDIDEMADLAHLPPELRPGRARRDPSERNCCQSLPDSSPSETPAP